jgi:hypothetical protein
MVLFLPLGNPKLSIIVSHVPFSFGIWRYGKIDLRFSEWDRLTLILASVGNNQPCKKRKSESSLLIFSNSRTRS